MSDQPLFDPPANLEAPLTVSVLTARLKFILEDSFSSVKVVGEISSLKVHQSGHLYFELKDENARISAVMFRTAAKKLAFEPQDGLKVVAEGAVSVYEPQGKYQIIVERMSPVGVGEMQIRFRQLYEKLKREGLYDPSRKVPLPIIPKGIGIATSPSGAAIRDMLKIIAKRNPYVPVFIRPTVVQGSAAAEDICEALKDLDAFEAVDVIIVGRGGGSYEDLFVFNDERIARIMATIVKPVISAVGHEVDFTISDFVADVRAATPSDAAVKVTADISDILAQLDENGLRLAAGAANSCRQARVGLRHLYRSLRMSGPLGRLRTMTQRVDELSNRLGASMGALSSAFRARLDRAESKHSALNPLAVLGRGYAIVRMEGRVVSSVMQVSAGDSIDIALADGAVDAVVGSVSKGSRNEARNS
ncbi:MAG: exodeoxyribonuclease VII large subunit [Candidatus Brocadiia bacterium]